MSSSPSERRHRLLVRTGYLLLVLAPVLALSHLYADARGLEDADSTWTLTLGSYQAAAVIAIIAISLVFREPPQSLQQSRTRSCTSDQRRCVTGRDGAAVSGSDEP